MGLPGLIALVLGAGPVATVPLDLPGASATIYFDDDAVRDAVWLGDDVVELTVGGVIVVRDRGSLRVVRHILPPQGVIGLAADAQSLYVALQDGSLASLDPVTGEGRVTSVAKEGFIAFVTIEGRVVAMRAGRRGPSPAFDLVDAATGAERHASGPSEFVGPSRNGATYPDVVALADRIYLYWQNGGAGWIEPDGTLRPVPGIGWMKAAAVGGRVIAYNAMQGDRRDVFEVREDGSLHLLGHVPFPQLWVVADAGEGSVLVAAPDSLTTEAVARGRDGFDGPWTPLAEVQPTLRFDPGLPVYGGSGGSNRGVRVMHAEPDGTVVIGSDNDGFIMVRPGGLMSHLERGREGYGDGVLISARDGLYEAGWLQRSRYHLVPELRKVGRPAWRKRLPGWLTAGNPWWDTDLHGRLRGTVKVGNELWSWTRGGPALLRTAIPALTGVPAPGLVYQDADRLLVDGPEFYAMMNGRQLQAGVLRPQLLPRPLPGSNRIIRDLWDGTVYELATDQSYWKKIKGHGAAIHEDKLVTGWVAEDGCGRLWTVDPSTTRCDDTGCHDAPLTVRVTDDSGEHDLGVIPGRFGVADVTARPAGIAISGGTVVHDIRWTCPAD